MTTELPVLSSLTVPRTTTDEASVSVPEGGNSTVKEGASLASPVLPPTVPPVLPPPLVLPSVPPEVPLALMVCTDPHASIIIKSEIKPNRMWK